MDFPRALSNFPSTSSSISCIGSGEIIALPHSSEAYNISKANATAFNGTYSCPFEIYGATGITRVSMPKAAVSLPQTNVSETFLYTSVALLLSSDSSTLIPLTTPRELTGTKTRLRYISGLLL